MRLPLYIIALLLIGTAESSAQKLLVPGSAELHTDRIAPAVDTFTITNYREGKPWRASTLVRAIETVREGERTLLRFVQTYDTPDGMTVDTTWVDAATLAPVRYFADVYGEVQRFTFGALEATGTVAPKDSAARTVMHAAERPFFNAVALELLWPALDIGDGWSVTIDMYNPPRMGMTMPIAFVARESVPLRAGGSIDALRLSFGPTGTHFWVDADTGALLMMGGGRDGNAFWKVRSDVDASGFVANSLG